ncbi:uncharacterized protein LOC113849355 [Abrus precatorius]|uniref:Uncharacterized protein LOC113849355 n=1 Tax=Abrus precatorius TaxID=3816 RepID=A0A8B8JU30_ABRPR|nr:uncharacterized protein LOC113849355 [Abrus precatorius]
MAHHQLIDSLTSHISLYHSQSPNPNPNPNPHPRSSILKWFSSLSLHHRQAYLTIVDSNFVHILLQMLVKLRSHGHGSFILLPDLPSRNPPFLPTLCFKKSRGLLARDAESDASGRLLFNSARLFESREGEEVAACSCSPRGLDAVVLAEGLVEDVDRFVDTMDRISNGGFLRGDESDLGEDWVELHWLKSKGYYSVEAFLANRIEVSMRLAWLNSSGGRKRGVKLKEKLNAAGVAANVFWRKKGCVDWWGNLDAVTRRKVFSTTIMKAAKPLIHEVLKVASSAFDGETWLYSVGVDKVMQHNRPVSAQRTVPAFPGEELDKSSSGKPKEKLTVSNRKKKGRNRNSKRQNPVPKTCVDDISCENPLKDIVHGKKKTDLVGSRELPPVNMGKEISMESSSSTVKMDHTQGLDVGKFRSTPRRSRKEKNKCKSTPIDIAGGDSQKSTMHAASTTVISEGEVAICDRFLGSSAIQNVKNDNSIGHDVLASNSSLCRSVSGPTKENGSTRKVEGETEGLAESGNSLGPQCCFLSDERKTLSSGLDTLTCDVDCNAITPPAPALKHGSFFSKEGTCPLITSRAAKADIKSITPDKLIGEVHGKEFGLLKEQDRCLFESRNSAFSKCSPYEWPGVPSIYFPSFNSHLPPATDRLHLDVGRNWHNHFCHPFVPTLPQARNTPIEGGCNQILSRPIPMSFDWPPVFRGGMTPLNYNYDTGFMSRKQCTFSKGLAVHSMQVDATAPDDERKYAGDVWDLPDLTNAPELTDEFDNHCVSEEEYEVHTVSGIDYNQYFGGGIMYWNPSDYPGKGFSRPPSLSSDDSLWALREADMNRTVDDMVAFSSSYSTNGLTSPTAATFCSPFDPVGTGPQPVGYMMSGNEVPGKILHSSSVTDAAVDEDTSGSLGNNLAGEVEGKAGDSHPYPILRPIIIPNLSRERFDHKSPGVPPTRREHPRIKRPPSPVVLCVPRAPRPPPPSPVSDSRKQRGLPTVRSGSSSPRHWGMRGWYHDGSNLEEACLRMDGAEVVWPWRSNNLAVRPLIQPLPAALLQDRLIAMSQIARDQEHPDVTFPLQPPELQSCSAPSASLSLMHGILHDEIDSFCKQVSAENMARRPYINWAVKRVTRFLQVLWPRSRTNIYGSNATGMSLPTSDVDLVVCLPPVRNLEPIKEAGILEGRNGIKETCLQHAARYLANQDWVKNDSLKTVENTAIPIIMLVVEVPQDVIISLDPMIQSLKEELHCMHGEHGNGNHSEIVHLEESALSKGSQMNFDALKSKSIRLDISFKSPSHTGLQTTEMVKELTEQFPAATPLALVLKQFLADRSLDQSYSGGLSSYCLVLLIIRFLQHEHHLGRPINQNYGSLLMDFLYFFGNVFDPRQMRISVQGSGLYIKRERGCSIDPIHIDDPLFPTNNVGRNCFRIHQCIKAFSEAYSVLENELKFLNGDGESCSTPSYRLLPKIIPSLDIS